MARGNPGQARALRGDKSSVAIGFKRKQAALQQQLERLDKAQKGQLPPLEVDEESLNKRAIDLLEAHQIKPEKALVETAMDYYRAEVIFTYLARTLELTTNSDQVARLGQSLAAQLKLRRAALADLGLPGDPDERDDFRRPSEPTKVETKKKSSGLDDYMED